MVNGTMRRVIPALAILAVTAAPIGARAVPYVQVAAINLRQGATHVKATVSDVRPYGIARVNGKSVTVECVEIEGQVGLTTLLIPWIDEGTIVIRARQENGRRLWIMIVKHPIFKALMSVKDHPDEDWGWCGTGGAAFTDATRANGYVLIA